MTINRLIELWADGIPRSQLYLNPDAFLELEGTLKRCVFVATLWSGDSQLAFRKVCKVLREHHKAIVPLLTLDSDEEIPEEYICYTKDRVGNGVLLMYSGDEYVSIHDGKNLDDLERSLRKFIDKLD